MYTLNNMKDMDNDNVTDLISLSFWDGKLEPIWYYY